MGSQRSVVRAGWEKTQRQPADGNKGGWGPLQRLLACLLLDVWRKRGERAGVALCLLQLAERESVVRHGMGLLDGARCRSLAAMGIGFRRVVNGGWAAEAS
jgi:hypothetical protein